MGDPSSLRFVASGSATINWALVPEASKKYLLKNYGYDWEKEETMPLPETVADLAKMFDETKFFGYLVSDILNVIMDISEFGLNPAGRFSMQAGPRFYMRYLEEIWFLLFAPGTRDCIIGYSDSIPWDEEDDDEKREAEETAIAEKFDVKLQRDVSRHMDILVDHTKKLGGWNASSSQSYLEFAQYCMAMMTLPDSHPERRALLKSMFRSISRR